MLTFGRLWLILTLFQCSNVKAETTIINMLVDDNFPPYSYVENAKIKGVYVDLVREAAKQLLPEYVVKLEAMPWKRALAKIEQGEVFAILPPYKHFDKRPFIGEYSIPLYTEKVVVFCQKDIKLAQAFDHLKSLPRAITLGLNSGYLVLNKKYQDAVANSAIILQPNKSTEANLLKLVLGRTDCYINDELTIIKGLKEIFADDLSGLNNFVKMEVISEQTAHVGYAKSHIEVPNKKAFIAKMNQALSNLLEQGFIDKQLN